VQTSDPRAGKAPPPPNAPGSEVSAAGPGDGDLDGGAMEGLRARARAEGVIREDALPFLRAPGSRTRGGFLLVHGFTATPWEMRDLAEGLVGQGYTALAVRLPGHGTGVEDLATRSRHEWLETVEEGYRLLNRMVQPVFGVGMSTGGLLLGMLAARRPLAGLGLLSPYLRLAHPLAPLAGVMQYWRPYQERPLEEGADEHYYRRRPLAGIVQLRRLSREVARQLPQLTLPTLVLAAEGDQTVDVASGLELFRRLGSRHKEYHRFGPDAPHVLTSAESPFRERVLEQLFSFFAAAPDWQQAPARGQQPVVR
jgi:carboxylesterase